MLSLLIPENKSAMNNNYSEIHSLTDTMNNAGIGTWSVDVFNNNFLACDLAKKLLGISLKDVDTVRKALKQLTPACLRKVYYAFYVGLHNQCPIQLEIQLGKQDGLPEDKWVYLTGKFNPFIQRFSGLVYDITDRKNCEINTAMLIAKLNHELRGPLCTIKLYTQRSLSIARSGNTDITNYLEKADLQINSMNNLIEDFLLVSTVENRKLIINKTFFLIRELLADVLLNSLSGEYNNRIIAQIGEAHKAYADRQKLTQVLINYISNAVKYSPANSKIIISSERIKGELRISVRDFGMGVSLFEQKNLFQKYYRCRNVADIQGYGIGLFVVREIIEAHQGRFGIISKSGEGSTFYFSLPSNIR